ncbi:hypothetical protein F5Y19DRAFT_359386 [Xylariaceae sp. FL1651]|nr:hypothetical protein F5Y19DRAFT_359386 [Xylariaceae sp. FL1651]
MAENTGSSYSTDPALYIYTSLTAGSSHIVTATSRLETILRANRVPFKALDIATDEKARMLWGRRAGKDESGRVRKLPALIQMGLVLGDLVEIEEWNEYGELKQHVTIYYDDFTIPPKSQAATPVAMRPLNQPFPKSGVAPSSSSPKTTTTASTSAPPPPAPPLPTGKDKSKIPLTSATTASNESAAKKAANAVVAPIRSIAEEAAQRAKQANLDRLREKVHGKKDAPAATEGKDKENEKPDVADTTTASTADAAKAPPTTPKKETSTDSAVSVSASMSNLTLGSDKSAPGAATAALQSPTTGSWRSGVPPEGGAQPLLQSPTSGTWKTDASHSLGGRITEHRGSVIASASAEEIAAVEKARAIPEEDNSEEEDEEDSEDDEDEDEDEDGDDDNNDDDDDESKDETDKKGKK